MPRSQAPATSLYSGKGRRKYLTLAERTRFLAAARQCRRPDVRALALTLAYTGCRISEALALTASSIECDEGFLALRSLKRRARAVVMREVPVPPELLAAFRSINAGPGPDARLVCLSRSQAWRHIKALMRKAGIPDGPQASPKGLRHGFGLHAIRCGVPLNLVQKWLGHAKMETTAIYLQAIGPEEQAMAERMWR